MKQTISWLALLAICIYATPIQAQQIKEDKITMHGADVSGFVATCRHNVKDVSAVMTSELEKAGLKRRGKNKKFYTLRGVDWPAISTGKLDVYYKVQKKGKHSKILFVASKGYDNYISSTTDAAIATNIGAFLSSIDAIVDRNEAILSKEAEINAMNAKLNRDKADMQKAEAEKGQKEQQLEQMKQSGN